MVKSRSGKEYDAADGRKGGKDAPTKQIKKPWMSASRIPPRSRKLASVRDEFLQDIDSEI